MIRREYKPSCQVLWWRLHAEALGEGLQSLAAGDCTYDMRPANRKVLALEVVRCVDDHVFGVHTKMRPWWEVERIVAGLCRRVAQPATRWSGLKALTTVVCIHVDDRGCSLLILAIRRYSSEVRYSIMCRGSQYYMRWETEPDVDTA
jgi:hypothetical protein